MARQKGYRKSIENHRTAAWSNIETMNELSRASHPSLDQTINAKEYVDENQK